MFGALPHFPHRIRCGAVRGARPLRDASLIGRFASLFGGRISLIAAPGIRCNAAPLAGFRVCSGRHRAKFPGPGNSPPSSAGIRDCGALPEAVGRAMVPPSLR